MGATKRSVYFGLHLLYIGALHRLYIDVTLGADSGRF